MDDRHDAFDEQPPNVEGFTHQIVSYFPFYDPEACRAILRLMPELVEQALANRAKRRPHEPPG